jgi:hypothetical protein
MHVLPVATHLNSHELSTRTTNSGKCGITLQFNIKWEQNVFTLQYSNLLNENTLIDSTSTVNRRTAEHNTCGHPCTNVFKEEVLESCNAHVKVADKFTREIKNRLKTGKKFNKTV